MTSERQVATRHLKVCLCHMGALQMIVPAAAFSNCQRASPGAVTLVPLSTSRVALPAESVCMVGVPIHHVFDHHQGTLTCV